MTACSLQAVLRKLANATPQASDGDLLRQFVQGEEEAFAELVGRHGRLVWAVCRHLTGSDAEADDAFQATFLVLLKNAQTIRDAARLSAWLHGVAYKVCSKARQSAKRRETRERATATREHDGSAVADSAWDRALAAVHEEVAKLPETLRVPFVLCCLEGKGATEAAEQLGWKLGTLSGRLTRAKDAVLAKLDARGLTLGVVVGLGLITPPTSAIAKAAALAQVGVVVPSSVLQLSQGVIGMSMKSVKLLVAAVVMTCGLGLGLGKSWIATAEAQTGNPPAKTTAEDEIKRLKTELERAQRDAEAARERAEALRQLEQRSKQEAEAQRLAALEALEAQLRYAEAAEAIQGQKSKVEAASAKTSKWEYDFVLVSEMSQAKFVEFLQDRETRGWEYNGLTKYRHDGKLADIWVFRRPTKSTTGEYAYGKAMQEYYRRYAELEAKPPATRAPVKEKFDDARAKADQTKVLEAQLAELTARLAELKGQKGTQTRRVFPAKDLPLEVRELAEVLFKLAAKNLKGPKGKFDYSDGNLIVEGDKELVDWVAGMIKKLSEK